MPIRRQVCAWVAAGSLVPVLAVAQERTERDVVDLIMRDGPRARAIRAETEVTRREQLARLAYPNPAVLYSREGAGFTEFLQVEQSLPVFGVRAALSKAGVAATAAADADRDARLWRLRAEAASTIAQLIADEARQQAAESHIASVARLIDVLATREREGEGSRFDRLRAEQELRDARQSMTSAAIAVADARAAVSALLPGDAPLGRMVATALAQEPGPSLDILVGRATSTRAELRALAHTRTQADREGEAARRARLPGPTVFGGLKRADNGSERERGGVFGITVSLPVFDTGSREAARWAAERTRVEAERTVVEDQIRAEITRASAVLIIRQRAVSEDQASAGDELMRIAEIAYREGEVGILELLDAVRTASRATFRTIEIRLEARLAQIAVERAVGDVLWP